MDKILSWLEMCFLAFVGYIPKLLGAVFLFVAGWYVSNLVVNIVSKTMRKGNAEEAAISFIESFLKFALRIIVIVSVISQLGVDVTSIITALGAATVTVGLALQDSMKNLAGGLLIILNKPFKVGDYLEFEGLCGTVDRIEILNTYIHTADNKEIVIPNSRLTSNNVINYSTNNNRRVDMTFSVSYSDDILKAKDILLQVATSCQLVLSDPPIFVGVSRHSENAVDIDLKVWCDSENYWDVYYEIQEKVKIEFDKYNITIPFPQIVIHKDS